MPVIRVGEYAPKALYGSGRRDPCPRRAFHATDPEDLPRAHRAGWGWGVPQQQPPELTLPPPHCVTHTGVTRVQVPTLLDIKPLPVGIMDRLTPWPPGASIVHFADSLPSLYQ